MIRPYLVLLASVVTLCGCSSNLEGPAGAADSGVGTDASHSDASTSDGAVLDAGTGDGAASDATNACTDALDIVFVLDVSTSMEDTLSDIRAGISDIWNTATGLSANAQFSLVVFVDDAVAVNGCAPLTSVADLQTQFDTWHDFCSSGESPVSHEINHDCEENSLDAIALAATTCPWRTPATRIMIHVTDDTFKQHPDTLSGGSLPVNHTYAQVAASLVTNEIRFATFANAGMAMCSDNSGAPGFHSEYMSQPSLPTQTGGRAWDLAEVRSSTLNMGTAISQLLTEEYCTVFLF